MTRSFSFVAYVEKENTESYPNDQFVHADIPLLILSKMLSLSIAKGIAASHGIALGSHCTVAQLILSVEQHGCHGVACLSYLAIFSVESGPARKHAIRSKRYRETLKNKSASHDPAKFSPPPSSIELEVRTYYYQRCM
jgi:hypothetical protein